MELAEDVILEILCINNNKNVLFINKYLYNLFENNKNFIGILKLKRIGYKTFPRYNTNYYDIYNKLINISNLKYCSTHVNILDFLYNNDIKFQTNNSLKDVVKYILDNNYFESLKFIIEKYIDKINKTEYTTNIYASLALGYFDIIKILYTNDFVLPNDAIDMASYSGNTDLILYLIQKKFRFTSAAISSAAYHGHLNVIKLCINFGCESTSEAIHEALIHSYNEIVIYLVNEIKIECDHSVINTAIEYNNIYILKFFKNKDIVFCQNNFDTAMIYQNIEIINFLYNECKLKITERTLRLAIMYSININPVIKMLFENLGEKLNELVPNNDLIKYSIKNGNIELVSYLYNEKNQKITKENLYQCIHYNKNLLFDYLLENYQDITNTTIKNLMRNAIIKNNLEIVNFLSNHIDNIPRYFLNLALKHKNKQMFKILKNKFN